MKAEDLGIDLRTGFHDKRLTRAEEKFVGILWINHVGENHKITADDLAIKFALEFADISLSKETPISLNRWKRWVRQMHNHLLRDHASIPVLSKAGSEGGYWIAENEEEAAEFYDTFRKRGLTGLVKASRGKQSAMVDMVAQLSFEFEELVDKTDHTLMIRPKAGLPTPIEVVDSFMERMLQNPDKFADGLRKIGAKYGSVLLPKEKLHTIQSRVSELEALVKGLGV